jgi:hypothetical protein
MLAKVLYHVCGAAGWHRGMMTITNSESATKLLQLGLGTHGTYPATPVFLRAVIMIAEP